MQIFHVISIVVPLGIAIVLPRYVATKDASLRQNRLILYVACLLFFISWYLPSPLIDGQDTSFVTHFVGGGIFCALLWLYIKRSLRLDISWWQDATLLFAFVSALGAVNELFEFLLVQLHIASILLTDTSWDIVANTSGALVGFIGYRLLLKK